MAWAGRQGLEGDSSTQRLFPGPDPAGRGSFFSPVPVHSCLVSPAPAWPLGTVPFPTRADRMVAARGSTNPGCPGWGRVSPGCGGQSRNNVHQSPSSSCNSEEAAGGQFVAGPHPRQAPAVRAPPSSGAWVG